MGHLGTFIMEQSDSSQTQALEVEEVQADVENAQAARTAERDVKVIASLTEDSQNLPKTYKLSESVLMVDNTDIHIAVASEDYVDASHSKVSVEEIDNGTNNQVKSELRKSNAEICTSEQEEIYDTKDEVNLNHKSQHLSIKEDQSLNVINEFKIIEDKEATDSLENVSNIIEDANQSDTVDKQNLELDESRLNEHGGQTHDSYESVEETIKEIHDNNSNQNNSIVTNAELTKLEQEETEVVLLVETIPDATDTTRDNFIVTLEEKGTNKECSQEDITFREKQITESDHGNSEIDLIDYNQESDDTIIEVTEVIDTPLAERYKEQNNTDYIDNNKCDTKSVIDGKIAINESINDENTEVKATDSKTLISSEKDDKEGITIIINEKIIITEVESEITTDLPQIKDTIKEVTESKQDDTPVHKVPAVDSSKKRSVIQDIFDDWGVENTDEDVQSTSRVHDSVEIELKSLLDETKTDQTISSESVVTSEEKVPSANEEYDKTLNVVSITEKSTMKQSTEQTENQKKNKAISKDTISFNKSEKNSPVLAANKSSDTRAANVTSHDTIPKSRSRHLTSQIASPAEVTEVLKERFREKQKNVDTPRGPDIFFVKKLTQRLSNKLAGGPVNPIPKLIPLSQQTASSNSSPSVQSTPGNCDKKMSAGNAPTETGKDGNSDNKELLAILEGDIDPDWSILKPPVLTEENKTPSNVEHSEQSNPPKLDPLVERELALKQLLELPITSSKKIPRKKKTFRAAPSRASKDATTIAKTSLTAQQKEASIDLASENAQPNTKSVETDLYSSSREKSDQKNEEQISPRIEESRSGRKRKPTEKAREHENTIKRQKVYRGKVSLSKKQVEEKSVSRDSLTIENHIAATDTTNVAVNNEKNAKEVASKQSEDKVDPILSKVEDTSLKRSKPSLVKKGPIAKKNMVKRLLRQKMPIDKKSVQLKTKLTSSKKTPPKPVSKSPKRMVEGDVKPKKKGKNEIDRLLQDEGVVNLLYDVEQPDRKRLVPITKSRAKVMDLQKVQRELKIRKKLVRNAVLRLRTSTGSSVTKVSPRSKRTAIHLTDAQVDKKTVEQVASPKTPNTAASPVEFILPAKIRNAADASIIIRRHSSSSFSSASGSPRVSVDSPEKSMEVTKSEDGTVHSLRSAKKRRDSQEEKINNAKKKKKTVQKSDTNVTSSSTTATTTITATTNNAIANNAEEKVTVVARLGKKSEIKKIDKIGKQQENIPVIEDNVSSKVTTRSSNGTVTGKITAKSKKAMKNKVTFVRTNDLNNADDSLKEEDELSACLAEAATALSVVNARSVATTRKSKGKGKHFFTFVK